MSSTGDSRMSGISWRLLVAFVVLVTINATVSWWVRPLGHVLLARRGPFDPLPALTVTPSVIATGAYAVVVAGDRRYVTLDGALLAETQDGRTLWTFDAPIDRRVPVVPAPDGSVYVAVRGSSAMFPHSTGGVASLGPDGQIEWTFPALGVAALTRGPDDVLYVSASLKLYALRADGTVQWSVATSGISSPLIVGSDGRVYTGGFETAAFNSDGTLAWKYSGDRATTYLSAGNPSGMLVGRGPPRAVSVISPSGALLWRKSFSEDLGGVAVSADGRVIVAAGALHAFDATGRQLWRYRPEVSFQGSVRIRPDGVVLARTRTRLVAVDVTGRPLWSSPIGWVGAEREAVDLAVAADGVVYAIETQQGPRVVALRDPEAR